MRQLQLLACMILLNTICYNHQTYTYQEPIDTITFQISKKEIFIITIALGTIVLSWIFKCIINNQKTFSSSQTIINGNGKKKIKKINIDNVTEFYLAGIGNLTIEQSETQRETLTIIADANIMPHLKHVINLISFYSSDKQLKLYIEDNITINPWIPITYHAIINNINKISSSGSMNTQSKNTLKTNILNINNSGKGNINLSVNVKEAAINLSGSGDIELSGTTTDQFIKFSGTGNIKFSGTTTNQNINLSGTGQYNAYNLESQNALIKLSGSGSVYVNVQKDLSYKLSGVGDICYKGNPTVKGSKSGIGKIKQA